MNQYLTLVESINSLRELDAALNSVTKGIRDVRMSSHFIERIRDRSINIDEILETIEKFSVPAKVRAHIASMSMPVAKTCLIKNPPSCF